MGVTGTPRNNITQVGCRPWVKQAAFERHDTYRMQQTQATSTQGAAAVPVQAQHGSCQLNSLGFGVSLWMTPDCSPFTASKVTASNAATSNNRPVPVQFHSMPPPAPLPMHNLVDVTQIPSYTSGPQSDSTSSSVTPGLRCCPPSTPGTAAPGSTSRSAAVAAARPPAAAHKPPPAPGMQPANGAPLPLPAPQSHRPCRPPCSYC